MNLPPMHVMPYRVDDPDAWRSVLGATDVGAVLGLSPYRSPLQVWLEKRGEAEEQPPNDAMKRGLLLEPAVAAFYEAETGATLAEVLPFRSGVLAASPDRYDAENRRFVEIKTHTPWVRSQYGEPWTDAVPAHVAAQLVVQVALAHELSIPVADEHDIAAFFGAEFAVFRIPIDLTFGADLLARAREWWQKHMVDGEPPMVGASDGDWVARMFPIPKIEDAVQADAETEALIAEYRQACLDAKAADAAKEALANRLKLAIGDAPMLKSTVGTFTYRLIAGGTIVDAKALSTQYPDVYAEVAKPRAGYRRLDAPKGWLNE